MNYIVDDIGTVVSRMRPMGADYGQSIVNYLAATGTDDAANMPYYMYGHRAEIVARLDRKNNGANYKKYPLVALRMDIAEEVAAQWVTYTLNIAILAYTKKEYNAEERMTNVIKPILVPLYRRFMTELRNSNLFHYDQGTVDRYIDENGREVQVSVPPHTRLIRPFWGTDDGEKNVKNYFNDPLDAIEIVNLKLKQNYVTRSVC